MADTSTPNRWRLVRHLAGPLFVLAMLAGSFWLLHRQLSAYHLRDFIAGLRQIPQYRFWLAIAFTVLNYLILIAYDVLGVRYIGHSLQLPRVALASFLGYAIGNNFGTLFGGATIRYRLYSSWGLSAVDVMKLVLILGVTYWIGLFALASFLFIWHPLEIPASLRLISTDSRPLGLILAVPAVGYLALCAFCKGAVRLGRWEFYPPPVGLSVLQYFVATLDLLVAAAVPYLLLPDSVHTDYPHFVCIHLLAVIAGLVSQVPGGLGVLELVILVLLDPAQPQDVMSAMLAYRLIYYMMPLGLGLLLLTMHEISLHGKHAARAMALFGSWPSAIAPRLLALTIFISGSLMLLSGATPATAERFQWLPNLMPLPVVELSHFSSCIIGMLLILVARPLQRRVATAYYVTCVLLWLGILVSILKGFYLGEAFFLMVILLAFVPSREIFFRKAAWMTERMTLGWLIAAACVLVCTIWLMFFSYKHIDYAPDLWWRCALDSDVSRSLRAFLGETIVWGLALTARLLRPRARGPVLPSAEDMQAACEIASHSAHTASYLALLGDKYLLFNQDRTAFVMYGRAKHGCIALGDPVGTPEAMRELAWELVESHEQAGYWSAFYQVDHENLSIYADLGMSTIEIGEEARVYLPDFHLESQARKSLRRTQQHGHEMEFQLELVEASDVRLLLPVFREISDAWQIKKHSAERGFSLGSFKEHYLTSGPSVVLRSHGRIIAFANLWLGAAQEELSVDLLRFRPEAGLVAMEFLLLQVMLWGKEHGYAWFNLGMAPFSGHEDSPHSRLWDQIASLTFLHAEHFYNFQGLRQYKDKFQPTWQRKYLAVPGSIPLPTVLSNVTALISGEPHRAVPAAESPPEA